MPPIVRIVAVLIGALFVLMAISALAQAIYLGWSAVASPAIAALATSISYLAIAIVAFGTMSLRSPREGRRPRLSSGNITPFIGPVARIARQRPAVTILIALAAGAAAEHLQNRQSRRD